MFSPLPYPGYILISLYPQYDQGIIDNFIVDRDRLLGISGGECVLLFAKSIKCCLLFPKE